MTDAEAESQAVGRLYADATVSTIGNWHSSARVETTTDGRFIHLRDGDESHFTYPRQAVECISTVMDGGHPGAGDRPARVSGARQAMCDVDGHYESVCTLSDGWIRVITPYGDAPAEWLVQDYPPEMVTLIEWDTPDTT